MENVLRWIVSSAEAEAASDLLESEFAEEATESATQAGINVNDVFRKILFSTKPHPAIQSVQESTGFTRPLAYAYRGLRKSLNGLGATFGIGDEIFKSALVDYLKSLYYWARDRSEGSGGDEFDVEAARDVDFE